MKAKISKENKNNQGGQEYESVCSGKVTWNFKKWYHRHPEAVEYTDCFSAEG